MKTLKGVLTVLSAFFVFVPSSAIAAVGGQSTVVADTVSMSRDLDTVVVRSNAIRRPLRMKQDGTLVLSTDIMADLPKILGNADPMHYSQMMPGVQTNSEYDSGIHIEGCDNTHNYVSIDGVPVYNSGHLLGFFSVFNPTHFVSMDMKKSASLASNPNRLGGMVDMKSFRQRPDSLSGNATLGLTSAQGTLSMPIGKRTALVVSGRDSYINLLYSKWLKFDDSELRYSFCDGNATLTVDVADGHKLAFDFYKGADAAKLDGMEMVDVNIDWGNTLAAVHYDVNTESGLRMAHLAYYSSYENKMNLSLDAEETKGKLKSGITTVGYKGEVAWNGFVFGADVAQHCLLPQRTEVDGNGSNDGNDAEWMRVGEYSAYTGYRKTLNSIFDVEAGVRGTLFVDDDGKKYWMVDPSVTINADVNECRLSLAYAMRHQNMFQTGFSTMGLPSEFWMPCGAENRPQMSNGLTLSASKYLFDGMLGVTAEAYGKLLENQVEYHGTMLDLLAATEDGESSLIHGSGYNYGGSVIVNKRKGDVRGWLSYSYGRSQRKFVERGYSGYYPSNHERPHELNMVVTYKLSRRVDFGATMVAASGTPFTAPKYFYMLNGNLLSEYGRHNANRLGSYFRLDLSANYVLKKRRGFESGLNLSLYNATCKENSLYYRMKYRKNGEKMSYSPVTFVVKVLPSISYYIKF